jgi:hypothetical protein
VFCLLLPMRDVPMMNEITVDAEQFHALTSSGPLVVWVDERRVEAGRVTNDSGAGHLSRTSLALVPTQFDQVLADPNLADTLPRPLCASLLGVLMARLAKPEPVVAPVTAVTRPKRLSMGGGSRVHPDALQHVPENVAQGAWAAGGEDQRGRALEVPQHQAR